MKRQKTLIIFSLGFILVMMVLSGLTTRPAQAQSEYQNNLCETALVVRNDDKVETIAKAAVPWSAAKEKLPGAERPPSWPVQSNDCAGVTPEKLRAGGVAVLACRLHCDPNIMSDDELLVCINQYSGQSGEPPPPPVDPGSEPPPIPVDPGGELPPVEPIPGTNPFVVTWDSLPAELIRNPLIPIAGGLTGAALAWLFSQLGTRPIPGSMQPKDVPPIDNANAQGLYWSERPWDIAGPGYVSKEEYERTKGFLERGYKWTNGGWQTPDAIQQSDQWEQNNRAAVAREQAAREQATREQAARENAARQAQREQERQEAIRAQREKLDKLEAESQKNQVKSPFNVELSAEAGNSGALNSSDMERGAGGKINVYKETYYDADDVRGDVKVLGYDIGDWKADLQLGKAQSGGGFGYDKKTGNLSAGGFFELSSGQLTGEGVVGNQYLGATTDGQIDGPKAEGFLGYKDGSVGVSIGGSLVSAETGVGLNVAGANVGIRGGISFGLEFGLSVGKETEIKIGPFKLGLSFGSAKTAQ